MSLKDPNPVNRTKRKRVAIVLSNPAVSTTTGWPVGFWWSELTHPYYVFSEEGYEVEVFSPAGGKCEPDALSDPRDPSGYSSGDLISMGFIATPHLAALVEDTGKVARLDVDRFDAIVVAGGQGPMFTFDAASDLHRTFVRFYEAGKWRRRCATVWRSFAMRASPMATLWPRARPSPASPTSKRTSPTMPSGRWGPLPG